MQQLFHDGGIALGGVCLKFLPRGAKPSPAHEVGKQRQVIVGHGYLLPYSSITRWRPPSVWTPGTLHGQMWHSKCAPVYRQGAEMYSQIPHLSA